MVEQPGSPAVTVQHMGAGKETLLSHLGGIYPTHLFLMIIAEPPFLRVVSKLRE